MKKIVITVVVTFATLAAIGKYDQQQKEIKDLKGRLKRVSRWNDHYYDSLYKAVRMLDRDERRTFIRNFNEEVDFIRITNHI